MNLSKLLEIQSIHKIHCFHILDKSRKLNITSHSISKHKILGINIKKDVQDLYGENHKNY